ncbi:MAG: response regulator transcription factor [Pseudomonadota bacterium]
MDNAPRALIVDDHPLFRDALETALREAFGDEAETTHAKDLASATDALSEDPHDLVLLDLNLPDVNGFDGLTNLKAKFQDTPIVIVSATESAEAFNRAQTLGAAGYMPKSLGLEEMAAVLATVTDGGTWFPASSSANLDDDRSELAGRVASLTPAQQRVLAGLSDGLLNKQIAYDMGISIATVKAHMTAIFRKLGANNRTQALLIYKEGTALSDNHSAA